MISFYNESAGLSTESIKKQKLLMFFFMPHMETQGIHVKPNTLGVGLWVGLWVGL
jgi:hypothetical protein